MNVEWDACHYWKLHSGAELDLFVQSGGRRLGFEFKFSDTPRATPSMLRHWSTCIWTDSTWFMPAAAEATAAR